MSDEVFKFCKQMEPLDILNVSDIDARGIEITSLASIAISLKRIADAMEKERIEAQIKINDGRGHTGVT